MRREKRLDAFFAGTLFPDMRRGASQDITGMIGDYAHGNEPCHHVVGLYRLIGREDKARALELRICRELYRPTPDGLCGNDDCGQMSAWYLRHAGAIIEKCNRLVLRGTSKTGCPALVMRH